MSRFKLTGNRDFSFSNKFKQRNASTVLTIIHLVQRNAYRTIHAISITGKNCEFCGLLIEGLQGEKDQSYTQKGFHIDFFKDVVGLSHWFIFRIYTPFQ